MMAAECNLLKRPVTRITPTLFFFLKLNDVVIIMEIQLETRIASNVFYRDVMLKTFAIAVISNGLKSNIRGIPELDGKITFMMLAGLSLAFHRSICSLFESVNMLEAATVM